MKQKQGIGFTLIELLITISVIAVIVSIGMASYSTINKKSRDAKRKSDLEQMRTALEMYRVENGKYPDLGSGSFVVTSDSEDSAVGLTPYLVPLYIPLIPKDPKSSGIYLYYYKATNQSNGNYYGYCLSGALETESPPTSCTPYTNQNYGAKNP